jgi:hypothetical protein
VPALPAEAGPGRRPDGVRDSRSLTLASIVPTSLSWRCLDHGDRRRPVIPLPRKQSLAQPSTGRSQRRQRDNTFTSDRPRTALLVMDWGAFTPEICIGRIGRGRPASSAPPSATSASWTDALTRASAVSWSSDRTPGSRCRTGPAAAPRRSCSRPLFKRLRTGRGRPSGIMHSQCGPPRCRFSYAAR